MAHLFTLLLLLVCASNYNVQAASAYVDLNGGGCDQIDGYYIESQNDVITLEATPQYNAVATRDRCDVKVLADQERRIQFLIEEIKFHECGVQIFIYDIPSIDADPRYVISCSENNNVPIQGTSRYNEIRVTVIKTTPQSRNFQFKMRMKNDLGPPLSYLIDEAQFAGQALEPGVIAGIAIAGAIIIIALILLAIYLCIRARQANMKDGGASSVHGESSVYTSGTSQVLFAPGTSRNPKGRYGSMEDIRSTSSSQDKANGAYTNSAYTKGPGEKRSERSSSIGRAQGKSGYSNSAYDEEDMGGRDLSWQEREAQELRRSRRDNFEAGGGTKLKSAMKKPTDYEMGRVSTQPNGILKSRRAHSPNRSQTSSTDASLDTNTMIHGYGHLGKEHPNVKHKPVIERRRSRSGPRSHRSGSSAGHGSTRSRRTQSEERKKAKAAGGRMYGDVFIDDRSHRSRSSGRRARSSSVRSGRTDRTSDSVDSESSVTSSRKVSMNPGGKRVHIKGEETDI